MHKTVPSNHTVNGFTTEKLRKVFFLQNTVLGGTGSEWGGTCRYLVVLGEYGAVLVGTWWN